MRAPFLPAGARAHAPRAKDRKHERRPRSSRAICCRLLERCAQSAVRALVGLVTRAGIEAKVLGARRLWIFVDKATDAEFERELAALSVDEAKAGEDDRGQESAVNESEGEFRVWRAMHWTARPPCGGAAVDDHAAGLELEKDDDEVNEEKEERDEEEEELEDELPPLRSRRPTPGAAPAVAPRLGIGIGSAVGSSATSTRMAPSEA